ncbi:uncharacterized protein LOC121380720 [Gigantopelta aegis]|uniref:uncharacterized protein LOC121380720 n=1 Tax=Gigantopelta aegis TaxID=1735272 RepID=UPI001B88C8B6|nr:uncharacterized protein LOC121380720 [Gigantopelta aegis]
MYHSLPKPYYSTPTHNYFSGDIKSRVWTSPRYYVPSERDWICYHDYRSLPSLTKRDAIDFQSEDDWVSFMRKRDTPIGLYHKDIGIKPCGIPALRLSGYTRNLPGMPPRKIFENPWPRQDAWVPPVRAPRGEYYGYYHEAIENERLCRKKGYPTSMRIEPHDVPKFLHYSTAGVTEN